MEEGGDGVGESVCECLGGGGDEGVDGGGESEGVVGGAVDGCRGINVAVAVVVIVAISIRCDMISGGQGVKVKHVGVG